VPSSARPGKISLRVRGTVRKGRLMKKIKFMGAILEKHTNGPKIHKKILDDWKMKKNRQGEKKVQASGSEN